MYQIDARLTVLIAALIAATGATPAPSPIELFVYSAKTAAAVPCDSLLADGRDAVVHLVEANAPNFQHVFDTSSILPADPLAAILSHEAFGETRYAIVANACRNGTLVSTTVAGYVIQKRNSAISPDSIYAGAPLSGTLDQLEVSNWSTLFVNPAYPGVGYLPVVGQYADVINAGVERGLPFQLTSVTDVQPLVTLCDETGYSLLIVGGTAQRNRAQADVFDCWDGNLWRLVRRIPPSHASNEDARAEEKEPPLHIVGGGTTLAAAVGDLDTQLSCIVLSRFSESQDQLAARQANSPVPIPLEPGSAAEYPRCSAYYSSFSWISLGQEPIGPARHKRPPPTRR